MLIKNGLIGLGTNDRKEIVQNLYITYDRPKIKYIYDVNHRNEIIIYF